MFTFFRCTLAVIQLLHVTPGNHKSFQSLATPVLFSAVNVFLVMLRFQTNELDDDQTALQGGLVLTKSGRLELGNNILWTLYVYLQPL